ncbi:GSCOCG00011196001-RA-CDS [Cotesia congregata]|nr:GSCOCG00011196001-RA-CDS [Cotesia congregata]
MNSVSFCSELNNPSLAVKESQTWSLVGSIVTTTCEFFAKSAALAASVAPAATKFFTADLLMS